MGPASAVKLRRPLGHQNGDVGESVESKRELVEKGGEEYAVRTCSGGDRYCGGGCFLGHVMQSIH